MTAVDVDALDAARAALAAVMPAHQSWCHAEAHGDCCGANDCDCGVADSLDALLPVVDRIANQRAAAELRAVAKWALLEAASHEGYAAKSMSRNSDLREAEARVFRAASNRLTGSADALDPS